MATLTGQSFLTELQALKKARTERDNLIKDKKAIQQRIVEFVKQKTAILQHREDLLGSLYINNYFDPNQFRSGDLNNVKLFRFIQEFLNHLLVKASESSYQQPEYDNLVKSNFLPLTQNAHRYWEFYLDSQAQLRDIEARIQREEESLKQKEIEIEVKTQEIEVKTEAIFDKILVFHTDLQSVNTDIQTLNQSMSSVKDLSSRAGDDLTIELMRTDRLIPEAKTAVQEAVENAKKANEFAKGAELYDAQSNDTKAARAAATNADTAAKAAEALIDESERLTKSAYDQLSVMNTAKEANDAAKETEAKDKALADTRQAQAKAKEAITKADEAKAETTKAKDAADKAIKIFDNRELVLPLFFPELETRTDTSNGNQQIVNTQQGSASDTTIQTANSLQGLENQVAPGFVADLFNR